MQRRIDIHHFLRFAVEHFTAKDDSHAVGIDCSLFKLRLLDGHAGRRETGLNFAAT